MATQEGWPKHLRSITGTISRVLLRKLLRERVERILAFPSTQIPWIELWGDAMTWGSLPTVNWRSLYPVHCYSYRLGRYWLVRLSFALIFVLIFRLRLTDFHVSLTDFHISILPFSVVLSHRVLPPHRYDLPSWLEGEYQVNAYCNLLSSLQLMAGLGLDLFPPSEWPSQSHL